MRRAVILGALILAMAAPAGAQAPAAGPAPVHDPADLRPEAPLPPDALVPGAPGVTALVCPVDPPPMDASDALGAGGTVPAPAADRAVRVDLPWTAQPTMTGAGAPVPVRFFKRGRTLIFDAGAETLYVERDHRSFTYTASRTGSVVKWRGTCRTADQE